MMINIDGVDYEIEDQVMREYLAEVDAAGDVAEPEGNRYVFGIHVHRTEELAAMGDDISSFMRKVGEGSVEVQVSVNAKLAEPKKDMVVGFDLSAIGYTEPTEDDYYYDEEEEDY